MSFALGFLAVGFTVASFDVGLRDGTGGTFSDFLVSVRVRFAGGEDGRSGEAARLLEPAALLVCDGAFSTTFEGGFDTGLAEAAREDRLGGIDGRVGSAF